MWQPGMTLAQLEKEVILKALRFYGGNKVQTAKSLGIAERTLYNRLEEYGIPLQQVSPQVEIVTKEDPTGIGHQTAQMKVAAQKAIPPVQVKVAPSARKRA